MQLRFAMRALALALGLLVAGCTGEITGFDPPDPAAGDAGPTAAPDAAPACPDDGDGPGTALSFDGVDDSVTMGAAPELGLATLTLEAWVRRDGRGETFGTGVGGVVLVPIAGKGRGESDGTNVDCNYAFGFAGDVLGADFEDLATGANHPIVGATAVPYGEWHHVAATYDGATWRLYLDGRLDAERTVDATPRADSIQHFGIGTAFNSAGVPAGRLFGEVAEVRLWNRALGEGELAAGMYTTLAAGDGLVARWALDRDDLAVDSAGDADGAVFGAVAIEDRPILDEGTPPSATAQEPGDDAAVAAGDVELAVDVADSGSEPLTVRFHVRALGPADDFTIVVLPDTQYYTVEAKALEQYFYDQTQWVRDHQEEYNIVAVIHNGDITDHGDRYAYEWTVADNAMKKLEVPTAALPDGVPYAVAVGNHDQTPNGTPGSTESYNRTFGVSRFAGRAYYGGHYGSKNDDSWFTFDAGGLDFVVVNLQYDTSQDPAVLAWARSIFQMHPDAFGILNTHFLLGGGGGFGAQGQAIYNGLRDVENVQIMTCGHVAAEARRTDVYQDHPIHTMLADYQGLPNGGSGYLRVWEFSPANDEVTVRTYSPTLDDWDTDPASEFTLEVDLAGSGGTFEERAVVEQAQGRTTARLEALAPGTTYEWYATVEDCGHQARTPIRRFTTSSSAAGDGDRARDEPGRAQRARDVRHPPPRPRGPAGAIED